nr:MAG TPA: hypothetical protein [Caudoviricetes sp.]
MIIKQQGETPERLTSVNLRPLIFTHTGNYPYVTFVICPKKCLVQV